VNLIRVDDIPVGIEWVFSINFKRAFGFDGMDVTIGYLGTLCLFFSYFSLCMRSEERRGKITDAT
jgi:hypothetical protein